ncbi:hypothetical protein H0X48_00800 [Candidatus Dependentiae bacterium]|nr:hypothetical protein [Candidatus Dependentiae bacterium]
MLRLLSQARNGMRFFKRVRVGWHILQGTFKAIIFSHQKYFLFCALITATQFVRLYITSRIDPDISVSALLVEPIMGRGFFDILSEHISLSKRLPNQELAASSLDTLLFFIEVFVVLFSSAAATYYTLFSGSTLIHSFKKAFQKVPQLLMWTFIQCFVLLISDVGGIVGQFLYLSWQLSSSLFIPILMFQSQSFLMLLRKTFSAFKQRLGNILGADLFFDVGFVLLTSLFYYHYGQDITPTFGFLAPERLSTVTILVMLYLNSILIVAEALVLANLYQYFYTQPARVKKELLS